ncbi:DUF1810 domain-containing protein [Actinoplanes sp. CA-131856]
MTDLDRFVSAQRGVYEDALDEIKRGRKRTHWMWFVFPQLAGLGSSSTARFYAIRDLAEARDYLAHPVLGPRLVEISEAAAASPAATAEQLFGYPDDLKARSSMTLFRHADPDQPVFGAVLDRYYDGAPDPRTEELLA